MSCPKGTSSSRIRMTDSSTEILTHNVYTLSLLNFRVAALALASQIRIYDSAKTWIACW